jgi:hypothetical protein
MELAGGAHLLSGLYSKEVRKMRKQQEIIECPECKRGFWDRYNLVCLNALGYCLRCANNYPHLVEKGKKLHER